MATPGYRPQKIRFGIFELDVSDRTLFKRGHTVRLQPQHFEVLLILVEQAGRIVSREEIRERIWAAETFVDFQRSINFAINQIRTALNDDSENPCFIETVPKRGYRFIAEVESDPMTAPDRSSGPVLVDRTPIAFGIPQPDRVLHDSETPAAQAQPIVEAAPARSSFASRNRLGILIAGTVVIVAFAVVWLIRNRSAAPHELKEQQLTHNASDNPITSVAVSPDGKYFAYADLGGLHVKLLQTGEIRDLPQPPELGQARAQWLINWFPDSTRFLAVGYGRGVPWSTWEASVLSGSMRLVKRGAVGWSVSPDGSQFAYTTEDERVMWVADIDGNRPRKIADAGDKNWFAFIEWSPDGSHLLCIKAMPIAGRVRNSMEITDVQKGGTTTLMSDEYLVGLKWLHDGRILYVMHESDANGNGCRYWLTRLNSEYAKFSTVPRQVTQDRGACISSISATGDSRRLYFLRQRSEFGIYVADLAPDATRISPPTHFTLTDDREFPSAWTADSRDIIFVSRREGKWGFYRQSLGSKTATPILTGIATAGLGAIFPRVTPDGAWLVYAPFTPDYVAGTAVDVFRVPISGGAPQQVMRCPLYDVPRCTRTPSTLCATAALDKDQLIFTAFDPLHGPGHELARFKVDDPEKFYTWDISPEGTRIAVLKNGGSEIHILSLRTYEDRKFIVKGWSGLQALDWASDGKGLFTSSRMSGVVLLHTDLQGNAHVLWEPKGDSMIWAVPSPDGHRVAMPGFALSSNIWSMLRQRLCALLGMLQCGINRRMENTEEGRTL
jgi:DNA-binding winged helix-turn-helix (wHTH) protein/Tol biopolymer transport system component